MTRLPHGSTAPATDPVALSWLVTVRWTTIVAGVGAVVAGRAALEARVSIAAAAMALGLVAASNVWLMWRVRAGEGRSAAIVTAAGAAVCGDVAILSWLLSRAGGVLNPASIYYLVEIVVAALVLGRTWTWVVAGLSVAGYATLFVAPTDALRTAQGMHPEIALHMRGMWLAFAFTAAIVAVLVSRLAVAVERRDRALDALRDRTARSVRAAGLATLAAGAAHELSTPLATIAVAAKELDRRLSSGTDAAIDSLRADARLIRAQADRCRDVLDALAGQTGSPAGEIPHASALRDVVAAARAKLDPAQASRLRDRIPEGVDVRWPVDVVARALANVAQNALQASTAPVDLTATTGANGAIQFTVVDRGVGMTPKDLSRAGEPFFTTKPPGAGTGLGLFVARSSVEQLGGEFTLASTPGVGTTATIALPRDVVAPVHET